MTDLSIIIVSFNTKEITKKCLETVIKSLKNDLSINAEIIVVDNASTDGSTDMLKTQNTKLKAKNYNLKLKTIINKENLGYSKANNQAVKKAQGKYLFFLNSDIEVIDDAIPVLYKFFANQNKFHFVGGKLLNKDESPQASCGPAFSLSIIFAFLFLRGDYYGLTRYSPDKIKEVDWVSGACILTGKDYFNKVGGFDEKIFMYMDEIDLFYRAKAKGYKVGFFPFAKFIHHGFASSGGRTQPILQVYKGFIYFYKKHYSGIRLKILIIMLKLKAVISLIIGAITGSQYLINTYGQAYKMVKDA